MNKITNISLEGLNLICKYEGFISEPYLCPANVPTIGYGTTRYPDGNKVKLTDQSINKDKALEYLKHDIFIFEKGVDALCIDTINQNQFDSLVSFSYNLGLQALKNSTLLKLINKNPNDPMIKKEFAKWVNAGGKKLLGLIKRRDEEATLYFK